VVADRLDVVPVGIEHVGGVVVRVVVRTETWRAVVAPSRLEGCGVERVDGGAVVAIERDVRAADRIPPTDPEVETAIVREVRERTRLFVDDPVAERTQYRLVEGSRASPVGRSR